MSLLAFMTWWFRGKHWSNYSTLCSARPVLRTFVQYLMAFCCQSEAPGDVISSKLSSSVLKPLRNSTQSRRRQYFLHLFAITSDRKYRMRPYMVSLETCSFWVIELMLGHVLLAHAASLRHTLQKSFINKKRINWWGRQNAAPLKFYEKPSDVAIWTDRFLELP